MNYISLFSSAGVGCYGFHQEGFECIASVELIEKRMQIQRYNNKCKNDDGYIVGDLQSEQTHHLLDIAISKYFNNEKKQDIDIIMATPPCQGMSVANHKKNNELGRNSLVVESIKITKKFQPKFFLFENVSAFSKTICTDTDGVDKTIGDAIASHLAEIYHIETQILNLKNYGANSSRTRTLVIGVRRDLNNTCPLLFFPDYKKEKTLEQVIGHLPSLKEMGEFSENDFFHSFRKYKPRMSPWIRATPYGKSAFDNELDIHKPHQVKDGQIVINKRKNGGKYQRQYWDKIAPCVHTRNDCLASQETIHPVDDRVFSIRELMFMMSIPKEFKWLDPSINPDDLESFEEKDKLRTKTDTLIRKSIGEAVPTGVISNIAHKIKQYLEYEPLKKEDVDNLIKEYQLSDPKKLQSFIKKKDDIYISDLFLICEMANIDREKHAAYHTPMNIAYACIEYLPKESYFASTIKALEPSVGAGIFVFLIAKKYPNLVIEFDCVDLDSGALNTLKSLANKLSLHNLKINYIQDDFITSKKLANRYDIVVGNPPFMKVKDKNLLKSYQRAVLKTSSSNIFTYFIEKSLSLAKELVFITPKALLGAPDYSITRKLLEERRLVHINDFNEKAFDVRIETISFYVSQDLNKNVSNHNSDVIIYSYLNKTLQHKSQDYITNNIFDTWLLYRDELFDNTCATLDFGIFKVFRDRQLTMKNTYSKGKFRVIKARNIGNNEIIDNPKINRYVNDISGLAVAKYKDSNAILAPNLTYNPRAARLPKGCVVDGSAAILYSEDGYIATKSDIEYFGSDEFNHFYRVARNYGTRSLNIDSNSVNYFGIKKASSE